MTIAELLKKLQDYDNRHTIRVRVHDTAGSSILDIVDIDEDEHGLIIEVEE